MLANTDSIEKKKYIYIYMYTDATSYEYILYIYERIRDKMIFLRPINYFS